MNDTDIARAAQQGSSFPWSFETLENRVYRENPTSAIAAALITIAHVQPNSFILVELTWFPITLRSLVRKTTMMTSGGANNPFRIADQNNIFTALIRAKSKASPTRMETAITA